MNALTVVLWAAAALLLLVVLITGLRRITRARNHLGRRTFLLHFTNQGNLNCHYALQAQEPAQVLAFQFLLNGAALPPYQPPRPAPIQALEVANGAPPPPASTAPARPVRKPPAGFKKKSAQARKSAGVVAGILSTLGALLPGTIGRTMGQAGTKVRFGQMQADRAAQVSSSTASLAGRAPIPESTSAAPPASARARPQAAPAASQPFDTAAYFAPARDEAASPFPGQWVQTPFVAPGENVLLDLHVIPTNPRRTQLYTFKVVARCIEANTGAGGGPTGSRAEKTETAQIQIRGIPWVGVYWPQLLWTALIAGLGYTLFRYLAVYFAL